MATLENRLELKIITLEHRLALVERFIELRFCETFRDFSIRSSLSGFNPGNNPDGGGFFNNGGNSSHDSSRRYNSIGGQGTIAPSQGSFQITKPSYNSSQSSGLARCETDVVSSDYSRCQDSPAASSVSSGVPANQTISELENVSEHEAVSLASLHDNNNEKIEQPESIQNHSHVQEMDIDVENTTNDIPNDQGVPLDIAKESLESLEVPLSTNDHATVISVKDVVSSDNEKQEVKTLAPEFNVHDIEPLTATENSSNVEAVDISASGELSSDAGVDAQCKSSVDGKFSSDSKVDDSGNVSSDDDDDVDQSKSPDNTVQNEQTSSSDSNNTNTAIIQEAERTSVINIIEGESVNNSNRDPETALNSQSRSPSTSSEESNDSIIVLSSDEEVERSSPDKTIVKNVLTNKNNNSVPAPAPGVRVAQLVTTKKIGNSISYTLPGVNGSVRLLAFNNGAKAQSLRILSMKRVGPSPSTSKQILRRKSVTATSTRQESSGSSLKSSLARQDKSRRKPSVSSDSDSSDQSSYPEANLFIPEVVLDEEESIDDESSRGGGNRTKSVNGMQTGKKGSSKCSKSQKLEKQKLKNTSNSKVINNISSASMTVPIAIIEDAPDDVLESALPKKSLMLSPQGRKPPPLLPCPAVSLSQNTLCQDRSFEEGQSGTSLHNPDGVVNDEERTGAISPDPPSLIAISEKEGTESTSAAKDVETKAVIEGAEEIDEEQSDICGDNEPPMPILSAASSHDEAVLPHVEGEGTHPTSSVHQEKNDVKSKEAGSQEIEAEVSNTASSAIIQETETEKVKDAEEATTTGQNNTKQKSTGSHNQSAELDLDLSEFSFDRKCRKKLFYCIVCESSFKTEESLDDHYRMLHIESNDEYESAATADETDERHPHKKRNKRQRKKAPKSRNSGSRKKSSDKTEDDTEEEEDYDDHSRIIETETTGTNKAKANYRLCPYCGDSVAVKQRFRHLTSKRCKITPEQLAIEKSQKGKVTWELVSPETRASGKSRSSGVQAHSSANPPKSVLTHDSVSSGSPPSFENAVIKASTSRRTNNHAGKGAKVNPRRTYNSGISSDLDNSEHENGPVTKKMKNEDTSTTAGSPNNENVDPFDGSLADDDNQTIYDDFDELQISVAGGGSLNTNMIGDKTPMEVDCSSVLDETIIQEGFNLSMDTEVLSEGDSSVTENPGSQDSKGQALPSNTAENSNAVSATVWGMQTVFCPSCSKGMLRKSLERHLKERCKGVQNRKNPVEDPSEMICKYEDCGYIPKNHKAYQYHLTIHPLDRGSPCPICKKVFIEGLNLQDHLKTHQINVPHDATLVSILQSKRLQPKVVVTKLSTE